MGRDRSTNELEGQPEGLGFNPKGLGKPLGDFKGVRHRVKGASVKMAPAVGRQRSRSGCAQHGSTCPPVPF